MKVKLEIARLIREKPRRQFYFIIPIIGLVLFLLCSCSPATQLFHRGEDQGRLAVRFVYIDDEAKTACVSGSFNNWSDHSDCMNRSAGSWSATLALPPGRYQYQFVVDGVTRREDPRNVLSEDNGFGTMNSVLIVE